MDWKNSPSRYGAVAKTLHWLMAALILTLIGLGIWMKGLPLGLDKIWYYNLHKSIGLIVLSLALVRLAWRHISPPPPLPDDQPKHEKLLAHGVHIGLYAAFIIQPLIGIVHSWASGYPIVFFNAVTLPNLMAADEPLAKTLAATHSVIGWTIVILVVLHIAGALKHHYLDKDDILTRMLPHGKSHT